MLIYSYKFGSKGAKALAGALNIKRIKHEGSKFKGHLRKKVINWGCSSLPEEVAKCSIINTPQAVAVAANKLKSFVAFEEANILTPEWTSDKGMAEHWLEENVAVVARTKLSGHSAEGLYVVAPGEELMNAPLYVKYKKKTEEYRVHVFNGEVIDVQRKARRRDVPDEQVNWQVRNFDNGFTYAREGVVAPDSVLSESRRAVAAVGLDFGAVDVIWNDKDQKPYVLEINTSPGLMGTTLENYTKAIFKKE